MILVTGASGYLGTDLLCALEQRGIPCVPGGRRQGQRFFDLNQPVPEAELLRGIDVVVHCAGLAHDLGQADEYERLNVDGSVALARAAIAAGVGRFVFVSSLNVVPASAEQPTLPPESWSAPPGPYAHSKWLAEQRLAALFSTGDSELISIRPALMYDQQLHGNLARLKRMPPIRLPERGKRSMVARPDVVNVLLDLVTCPPVADPAVRYCAITDGQTYTAKRISSALVPGRALTLPESVWSLLIYLLEASPLRSGRALVRSLAEEHWTASDGKPTPPGARRSLEALQCAAAEGKTKQ